MGVPIEHDYRQLAAEGVNRYEAISLAFERGIADGRIPPGSRLPTVRLLSAELGVSEATVAAAYQVLQKRGWTRGEVGRGTFVVAQMASVPAISSAGTVVPGDQHPVTSRRAPWRRRAVLASAARLRAMYPAALDCTSGKPDPSLFLTDIFRRSWHRVIDETDSDDLQYASPEPVPVLARQIRMRAEHDRITTDQAGMVIGSSAQQLMVLSLAIVARLGSGPRIVAVEEPGYQTVFDAFEYLGFRLIGMQIDSEGVIPQSLASALNQGASAVLFTPRAQNPYGASWSETRRADLAHVLSSHQKALIIEDDQFADLAWTQPGSLLNDPSVASRVIYIRSFAKAIAPDIRIAAALAQPSLLNMLAEAKSYTDGWSSRLAQRALATLLADPDLDDALSLAREDYRRRRAAATTVLAERLAPSGAVVCGTDGLNLWIQLSPGIDAGAVIERAAGLGVLCTPGEPFFIRPGRNDVLRLSISGVNQADATVAANRVADAVLSATASHVKSIPI